MKTFLFIILAGCAVKCHDTNYYVVQMPQEPAKEFKVYWNVPTMQCKSKKILFQDLYEKYGIIQNTGDSFRGDKISILYDPGAFPALLRNSSSGEIKYRNGGVPQEGDLIKHLDAFQRVLDQSIPDRNYSGVGIIDFESWRPILRQNFGVLTPYKDVSYEIEKKRHWWWKKPWLEEEAKRRFETSGRDFMQATIALAKKMRPSALWGYYGFPYCFNMAYNNRKEACADKVQGENDRISWLWQESTALFPSVYSSQELSAAQLAALVRARVSETARVAHNKGATRTKILPYFWYRYRDDGFLREEDLEAALKTFYKTSASGFIIWGSSNDVNTVEKCKSLQKYVDETLGPAVAKYTKKITRLNDDTDVNYHGDFKPSNATKYDPEYTWIPPVNYTQNIEKIVETELKEEEANAAENKLKDSVLIDIILHSIANYCVGGCNVKNVIVHTQDIDEEFGLTDINVPLVTKDPFSGTAVKTEPSTTTTTASDVIYVDLNTDSRKTSDNTESTTSAYHNKLNKIEDMSTTTEIFSTTTSNNDVSTTEDPYVTLQDEIAILANISFVEENNFDRDESYTESYQSTTEDLNATLYDEINIFANLTFSKEKNRNQSEPHINKLSTSTTESYESTTEDANATLYDEISIFANRTFAKEKSINKDKSLSETSDTNDLSSTTEELTTEDSYVTLEDIINIISNGTLGKNRNLNKISTENPEKRTTTDFTNKYSTTEINIRRNFAISTTEMIETNEYSTTNANKYLNNNEIDESSTTDSIFTKISTEPSAVESYTWNPSIEEMNSSAESTRSRIEEALNFEDEEEERRVNNETTTLSPIKEQVSGGVSGGLVTARVACSIFYMFSVTKCLCYLFGYC